jgi:TolA-binding protein
MNTNLFVVFILSLTCGMTYFYAELREYFNPLDQYKEKVVHLEEKVKEERFRHLLTSYEFQDFRVYVATLLPKAIEEKGPGEKSYQLRGLASVVQKGSNEKLAITRSKVIFEDGKKQFREKNYDIASMKFREILKDHPYSPYVPESLFLLVEINFMTRKYDQCVSYANKLLDLYPENELTGFAMLRLGKVYELQDRQDDAVEIYKTVIKVFPSREIASLASESLRSVEL